MWNLAKSHVLSHYVQWILVVLIHPPVHKVEILRCQTHYCVHSVADCVSAGNVGMRLCSLKGVTAVTWNVSKRPINPLSGLRYVPACPETFWHTKPCIKYPSIGGDMTCQPTLWWIASTRSAQMRKICTLDPFQNRVFVDSVALDDGFTGWIRSCVTGLSSGESSSDGSIREQ